MKETDILIAGGGAAGLMAAYGAGITRPGSKICIIEKMPRPGRKIMITGKGRCNFTNVKQWNEFQEHIHPKANFLRPAFYNLNPEKLMDTFRDFSMDSVVERGDRAFPADHKSMTVVDTLVDMAEKAGAELVCNCSVTNIIKGSKESHPFIVNCSNGESYTCKKLIICCGGMSYPKTGSEGDAYKWAEKFGHSISPLFPSLCALTPRNYNYTEWIALKNINLSSVIDGNEIQSAFGDIDFTDGGIEGPLGFKLSRKCVKALKNGSKVKLILDLKPNVELSQLEKRIQELWDGISKDKRSNGKSYQFKFKILLGKLIPQELIPQLLAAFPDLDHKRLGKVLKSWTFDITSHVGYERCVITAGGVKTDEVNPKTLESKKEKGLHFAGEILDLDADTGGYNLHIAFCTGFLAGQSAAKALD